MPARKLTRGPNGFRNNYASSVTRSLRELLRWQWQRYRAGLPHPPQVPTPSVAPNLAFLAQNSRQPQAMVPSVTWIGHATALVQASGLNVLTDPVFSLRASPLSFLGPKRAHPPAIALHELPAIDIVVISHNHYDHLDKHSVQMLAHQPAGSPLFLVPSGIRRWLNRLGIERAIELDWWECHEHRGVEFHFTPAQHWSGRSLADRNRTLWGSWAVLGRDFHWFFSGDTGYSADFADIRRYFAERQHPSRGGGFDVALIAVGACEPRWFMKPQHVNPAEAVQIHLDLNTTRSVGIHWGTFQLSDEPLDHAINALDDARHELGVEAEVFALPALGQTRCFPPRA
jgi:N-acyl-phosphatidylethanolamine-hydrolysing phospholipase D